LLDFNGCPRIGLTRIFTTGKQNSPLAQAEAGRRQDCPEMARTAGSCIAPEITAQLFKPFVATRAGAMGIGPSISRRIVESHDGTIGACCSVHGGASFRFTLPAHEENQFDANR
jgi:nitrogen-specific signal transduction histidine kinase